MVMKMPVTCLCCILLALKASANLWSRGLKSLFNIDDVTDDVIVNETEKVSEEVATLPPLVYYLLVREGARSQYLDLIESDCLNHTSHK